MYKTLLLMLLIMLPFSLLAETETAPEPQEKPQFSEDQMDRLKTAEEKYKDNPEVLKLINTIKEKSGLTEDAAQPATPAAKQEPAFQGSLDAAKEAYKKRDYETALKNYQALAADGNAEASLELGTMYEMGYGTEKDSSAAQAWYKKAAEAGDSRGKIFAKSIDINTDMSDEALKKADEIYTEISKEPGSEGKAAGSIAQGENDEDRDIKFSVITPAGTETVSHAAWQDTRTVKISPEKLDPTQHQKLGADSDDHLKPDRYYRIATGSDQ